MSGQRKNILNVDSSADDSATPCPCRKGITMVRQVAPRILRASELDNYRHIGPRNEFAVPRAPYTPKYSVGMCQDTPTHLPRYRLIHPVVAHKPPIAPRRRPDPVDMIKADEIKCAVSDTSKSKYGNPVTKETTTIGDEFQDIRAHPLPKPALNIVRRAGIKCHLIGLQSITEDKIKLVLPHIESCFPKQSQMRSESKSIEHKPLNLSVGKHEVNRKVVDASHTKASKTSAEKETNTLNSTQKGKDPCNDNILYSDSDDDLDLEWINHKIPTAQRVCVVPPGVPRLDLIFLYGNKGDKESKSKQMAPRPVPDNVLPHKGLGPDIMSDSDDDDSLSTTDSDCDLSYGWTNYKIPPEMRHQKRPNDVPPLELGPLHDIDGNKKENKMSMIKRPAITTKYQCNSSSYDSDSSSTDDIVFPSRGCTVMKHRHNLNLPHSSNDDTHQDTNGKKQIKRKKGSRAGASSDDLSSSDSDGDLSYGWTNYKIVPEMRQQKRPPFVPPLDLSGLYSSDDKNVKKKRQKCNKQDKANGPKREKKKRKKYLKASYTVQTQKQDNVKDEEITNSDTATTSQKEKCNNHDKANGSKGEKKKKKKMYLKASYTVPTQKKDNAKDEAITNSDTATTSQKEKCNNDDKANGSQREKKKKKKMYLKASNTVPTQQKDNVKDEAITNSDTATVSHISPNDAIPPQRPLPSSPTDREVPKSEKASTVQQQQVQQATELAPRSKANKMGWFGSNKVGCTSESVENMKNGNKSKDRAKSGNFRNRMAELFCGCWPCRKATR